MIAVIVISAGIGYFLSLPFASLLQGGNYRLATYFSRGKRWLVLSACYAALFGALTLCVSLFISGIARGTLLAICYLIAGLFTFYVHKKMRLRLTVTNRLARLLVVGVLLYVLLFLPLYFLSLAALWAALPALSPFTLVLAALLVAPFERWNNERYLKNAKGKLDQAKGIKVGITGSYGKTGVKNALEQLLSTTYRTLATPANYNTPLGIARTLEQSTGSEDIYLLEMGARKRGDIRELCELIRPMIGIITGIAPQHLETFGGIEEIATEKNRLAELVPFDRTVYYNLTDEKVRALYDRREGKKVGVGFRDAEAIISELTYAENGSAFTLVRAGKSLRISIPLYGRAAVTNVALACVVALDLGVSEEVLLERAKRIAPAPHRFEVVRKGGVIIVDDSYNINPVGAEAALSSLSLFGAKRIVVYTSGIVEMGRESERGNLTLGKQIAAVADLAIVGGGRYGDLVAEGMLAARPEMALVRVEDTTEATASFRQVIREGDLLLIMSDLPRDYLV